MFKSLLPNPFPQFSDIRNRLAGFTKPFSSIKSCLVGVTKTFPDITRPISRFTKPFPYLWKSFPYLGKPFPDITRRFRPCGNRSAWHPKPLPISQNHFPRYKTPFPISGNASLNTKNLPLIPDSLFLIPKNPVPIPEPQAKTSSHPRKNLPTVKNIPAISFPRSPSLLPPVLPSPLHLLGCRHCSPRLWRIKNRRSYPQ